jgi:hypothetical protein
VPRTHQTRIQPTDIGRDILIKMSGGNPGGLQVLMSIYRTGETVDPQAAIGGFAHLLILGALGIYGSDIWVLYKDLCQSNIVLVIAILRAWHLGMLSEDTLLAAIKSKRIYGMVPPPDFDPVAVHQKVKERLPQFADYQPAPVSNGSAF